MSTTRFLHVAKDRSGNKIPCIGFNFGLTLKRKLFPCSDVIKEAENLGIPTDVFRENTKKNSFVKAVKKNLGKVLDEKGTIIHEVEKTSEKIVYHVDRKVLTETEVSLFSSETNSEENTVALNTEYQTIGRVIYDCSSDKVLCDNQEVLSEVLRLLKVYEQSYEKAQFSLQIRRILNKHGDIIPWVDSGHAYFVPAKHSDLMFKLFKLVTTLDPTARITRGEVPDLTFSKQTVADSANEAVQSDMKFISDRLQKLYSDDSDQNRLTPRIAMNTVEELAKAVRRVDEYKILCERDLKTATGKIEEVQQVIKEYLLTGKITKKEATAEEKVVAEAEAEVDDLLIDL